MAKGGGKAEPKTRRVELVFDLQDEAQKALITEITESARRYKRPLAEHLMLCARHGRRKAEERARARYERELELARDAWDDDEAAEASAGPSADSPAASGQAASGESAQGAAAGNGKAAGAEVSTDPPAGLRWGQASKATVCPVCRKTKVGGTFFAIQPSDKRAVGCEDCVREGQVPAAAQAASS